MTPVPILNFPCKLKHQYNPCIYSKLSIAFTTRNKKIISQVLLRFFSKCIKYLVQFEEALAKKLKEMFPFLCLILNSSAVEFIIQKCMIIELQSHRVHYLETFDSRAIKVNIQRCVIIDPQSSSMVTCHHFIHTCREEIQSDL